MKFAKLLLWALALITTLGLGIAYADEPGDPKAVKQTDGEWYDAQGNPTYKIDPDGTVDWYTNVGYLQFGANCLVCHGPDGLGSSYAPNLTESLKHISYPVFAGIVIGGKRDVSASQDLVMPAFGTNKNVTCHLDQIYVYLRARSTGALGRGRPAKAAPKPAGYDKKEDDCFGD